MSAPFFSPIDMQQEIGPTPPGYFLNPITVVICFLVVLCVFLCSDSFNIYEFYVDLMSEIDISFPSFSLGL